MCWHVYPICRSLLAIQTISFPDEGAIRALVLEFFTDRLNVTDRTLQGGIGCEMARVYNGRLIDPFDLLAVLVYGRILLSRTEVVALDRCDSFFLEL